jgi:ribosome-binding protein aMBF1 (putative translation factor)
VDYRPWTDSQHTKHHRRVSPRPHPVRRQLGRHVRDLRTAKGWSQEEFADLCGLDRSYVSGIERGVRNISVLSLAKVAKALGVTPASLLG